MTFSDKSRLHIVRRWFGGVLKGEKKMSFYLIPGKYSEQQIAVIEKFCPLYAPDAKVLYLGDALDEAAIHDKEQLEQLGVSATAFNNLPDIILYNEAVNQLYLIEAGISHRVVTHKRRHELEELFRGCSAIRIYVSVFLNHAEFGRYVSRIAWESHVWIAECKSKL